MKRCSKCKKICWPWQDISDLNCSPTPIHAKCHAKIVYEYKVKDFLNNIPISDLINIRKSNIHKYFKDF